MASEDGEKIALPMAGRSVAKRSDPVTVSTPRGPVEVVRQQWRSQRPGSKWDWEWLARLRVCVTGDRAQPRARRSDRRRCCRRESSLRGCSTQLRAQRRNWSEEGRKGPPRRRLTRIRLELGAPSAVPPAFACRGRGRGKRGRPAARAARGERRGGSVAGLLLLVALVLGLYARHWRVLAGRSRQGGGAVGDRGAACSRWAAAGGMASPPRAPMAGSGDLDSVAIAPTGIGFAIETKTRNYEHRHLTLLREQAAWLSRRWRRWGRRGTLPVLCVVRARGIQRQEDGVLVVSIDQLASTLRSAAPSSSPTIGQDRGTGSL